jgi:hypothetical protein
MAGTTVEQAVSKDDLVIPVQQSRLNTRPV